MEGAQNIQLKRHSLLVNLIFVFAIPGWLIGASLEYAPAPPDNPLRGLVPYASASGKAQFPHSMEFLYYLKDPHSMLNMFHDTWLKSGGMMVAGVDHYLENEDSLSWPDALDVHMTTMSEAQWHEAMLGAGFVDVRMHRVGLKDGFVGTLVMIGRKQ